MNGFAKKRIRASGFTLMELLLVITIISVLAAVTLPSFFGKSTEARIAATRREIVGTFGIALQMFEQHVGRYPTPEEGLDVLIQDPGIRNWNGPYIQRAMVPLDPWGNEYNYTYPSELTGSEHLYDVVSAGPDGTLGTSDDISNHPDIIRDGI